MLKIKVQPAWLEVAADDSYIASKDLAEMFGITKNAISKCVARGTIPEPDFRVGRANRNSVCEWKVSTVKEFLKKLGEKNAKT